MIKSYFKTAWRSLLKNKGISLLNIAGLSIGMTAAVLIFLWVDNEMSFDNYHADAGRIYRLTTRLKSDWVWEGSPMLLADAVKKGVPGIEKVARLYADNQPVFNIGGNLQSEKQCAYVDESWFDLFRYHFIEGNAASFAQSPYSIILTVSEAKRCFGNHEAIGEMIRIDSMNYEVKAVVADAPANSSFQYKVFIPVAALLTNRQQRENGENWDNTDYLTFIKLQPGLRPEAAAGNITALLQKYSHDDGHSLTSTLISLKDIHFEREIQATGIGRGNIVMVYIFSILGSLLLLVACINYVNLTTAKASIRSKEVSIRKIVGAARRQLFCQFMAESFLVSILSLAVTLLLIHLCLPAFNGFTGENFTLPFYSWAVWKVLGGALIVSFLLNSIYPALLLSSFKPLNIFRGITVLKVNDAYFRKGLVVLQFTISVILITCTVVIYRQMHFIQSKSPGYDRSQVLTAGLPFDKHFENKEVLLRTMKQALLASSSIERVSTVNQPVVHIGSATTGVDWDGRDTSFHPKVNQLSADGDLAGTLHMQMAAGRWFGPAEVSDRHNFILNETAVRELRIPAPVIGQRFSLHGVSGRIIGVVRDFNYKSMHERTGALVVFNNPDWWNFFLIRTSPQGAARAIQAVTDVWKQLLPGVPVEYSFLDDRFNDIYRQDRKISTLIFLFAAIAMIISSMGLFGLAAFAAERRTREIGIRKILGATLANIGMLLSRDFIKLVGISMLIAFPAAWWVMTKWLDNFAYRIPIRWWMCVVAGMPAMIVALIITGYHAVRVGVRSPVQRLRVD